MRRKISLLLTLFMLFSLCSNEDSFSEDELSDVENRILELEVQEDLSPEERQELEDLEGERQEILKEDDEITSGFLGGPYVLDISGCLDANTFTNNMEIFAETSGWEMHVLNSINQRKQPISDEEREGIISTASGGGNLEEERERIQDELEGIDFEIDELRAVEQPDEGQLERIDTLTKRKSDLNNEIQTIENSINDGSDINIKNFKKSIDWGILSLDSVRNARETVEQVIAIDRLSPTPEGLEYLESYHDDIKQQLSFFQVNLLPPCKSVETFGGDLETEDSNLANSQNFSIEYERIFETSRYCEVINNKLDCPETQLYVPEDSSSCSDSSFIASYTSEEQVDIFFPTSIYNTRWMRHSFGTKWLNGTKDYNILKEPTYKPEFDPPIIFPGESIKGTIFTKNSGDLGKSRIVFPGPFSTFQNGNRTTAYVYDDASNGDKVSGDGIFTNNCIFLSNTPTFNNEKHIDIGGLIVVNPGLKGSVEIKNVGSNVVATDTGLFIDIGYDATQFENNNNPLVYNPNSDAQVYQRIFSLFDDNINIISLNRTIGESQPHMMRLADHVRGTGFYYRKDGSVAPAQQTDIKDGEAYIDGKLHLELQAVLMLGSKSMDAFIHEFEHSIFGMTGTEFPGKQWESLDYPDGAHLTGNTTLVNSLQGCTQTVDDEGLPKSIVIVNGTEEYKCLKIIEENGKFKLIPREVEQISDLFLYNAGVLDKKDVTDTYHLLVSPLKFSNCGELPSKIVCTQKNEVTSDKIYSFNIDDWIDFYGPRTYAYGQEPEVLNIAMTTFSSRPFTEAEITYTHNMRKQRIEELDKWWSGLSNVNIDALDMLANSASYAEMKKDEYRPTAAGNLLVDNIDIYKELFYQGLESNSNKLLEDAVNLIPGLPNAYMGLASLEDDPIKKYEYLSTAFGIVQNIYPEPNSFRASDLYSTLLEEMVKINTENDIDENLREEQQDILDDISESIGWQGISLGLRAIDEYKSLYCKADIEQFKVNRSDCKLTNISVSNKPGQEIWYDENLDYLLSAYGGLASSYETIGRTLEDDGASIKSLQFFLKAIDARKEGISFDPKASTSRLKFLLRDIAYAYDALASHSAIDSKEEKIRQYRALGTYYFELEKKLNVKMCKFYAGTLYAGGYVGDEDGKVYVADYYCGRPSLYEPEDGKEYDFDFLNWEWIEQ